ncbi:hypothetical protein BGX33_000707 [Mortierella sp. NVP41]|nr:hypothetical protein BGX33_000707 [Mortierella sp. NVP41]
MTTIKPSPGGSVASTLPSPSPSTLSVEPQVKKRRSFQSLASRFSPRSSDATVGKDDSICQRDVVKACPSSMHSSQTQQSDVSVSIEGDDDNKSVSSGRVRTRDKIRNFFGFSGQEAKPTQKGHATPILPVPSTVINSLKVQDQDASQDPTATMARCVSFPNNGVGRVNQEVLPPVNSRINKTSQLLLCIRLLQRSLPGTDFHDAPGSLDVASQELALDSSQREWVEAFDQDPMRQRHIQRLAARMVDEFVMEPTKDSTVIAEIVLLGPVLERERYRRLLSRLISEFERSRILDVPLMQGLVQLVQDSSPGYLEADDLITILGVIRARLETTHQGSAEYPYRLVSAVSHLLDTMADHKVQDLDRISQQEPLTDVLSGLKNNPDPFLMYQACYAFQALQYVPNNETPLRAFLRHSAGMADGLIKISGLVKLDLGGLLEGLKEVQKVVEETAGLAKSAYEGSLSLLESGRGILDSIREGVSSGQKRPWYLAIRGADVLVREGRLADLSSLIRDANCRKDPLFQWGICQLLAEIAIDSTWDINTRQYSTNILAALYKTDADWKRDVNVRKWMLILLKRIAAVPDQTIKELACALLDDLPEESDTDLTGTYPLRTRLPTPQSLLLARVQGIPDVEDDLFSLKIRRQGDWVQSPYVPPRAKASLQSRDNELFSLMENVQEFLSSKREVMLLVGDSGSGKSTFNRHLEQELWAKYKEGDPIPLFINLPTIDKPQQNMIAKQLETYDIPRDKILEIKRSRDLVLICDGYDECQQQSINLHTTNGLNKTGEWRTKMIISCRSQYIKPTYLLQFQPQLDRYSSVTTTANLFQEAVIAPFSRHQIRSYVEQHIQDEDDNLDLHDRPSWNPDDYMQKLATIPDLMDLVKNPFLLRLALVALPSVVATTEDLRTIRVSRVELYDIFARRWLESGIRRLQDSSMSDADREVLVDLIDADFVPRGIDYLKRLSTAIYDNNERNPVIAYVELTDKDTWKAEFFSKNPQIRFLRDSSPLIPAGKNQHRFLHRSLLEYFYSRTFSDAKDPESDEPLTFEKVQQSISEHPLRSKSALDDRSAFVVQFLAERAVVDTFFKQQLLAMVESLETDNRSVQAAVHAVTILTKAGIRFNGLSLSGVRIQQRP